MPSSSSAAGASSTMPSARSDRSLCRVTGASVMAMCPHPSPLPQAGEGAPWRCGGGNGVIGERFPFQDAGEIALRHGGVGMCAIIQGHGAQ